MKTIELTQGQVTLVDDEDYEWLNQWKWYANKAPYGFYAMRHSLKIEGRPRDDISMHRIIIMAQKGEQVDHKDGNRLNNCRSNLRLATVSQNRV